MISALQRRIRVAMRRRDAPDQLIEEFGDAEPGLCADMQRALRLDPDDVLDLRGDPAGLGGRQVDLVQHRNHLQPLFDCGIAVGDRLGLDALRGVDDEQCALAGRERARDLVAEIDVSRGIDEIQEVGLRRPAR
jgi:hypothetical protein